MTDRRTATIASLALFALGAWPLLLWDPPLQDLPNHMASVELLLHPEHARGLVSTGLLKTNALSFAFMLTFARLVGVTAAARLFVTLALGSMAFALPRFVLAFGGRERMLAATCLAGPLVHQWLVDAGSVNYVFAVSVALFLLIAVRAQLEAPSLRGGLGVAALSLLVWYAHVFALTLAGLLVLLELAWLDGRAKRRALASVCAPLVPAGLLVLAAFLAHERTADVVRGGRAPSWLSPPELVICYWKYLFGGFTPLALPGALLAGALVAFAARSPARSVPLVGLRGLASLVALYCLLPTFFANWAFFNVRVLPFVGAALLLHVPGSLARGWRVAFGAASVLVSVALGIDYYRLDLDRRAYLAGLDSVPEGARLLPLGFVTRRTSWSTHSLEHAWGYYVVARHTEAPLVFADSRLFAWVRPGGMPPREHVASWAQQYRSPSCDDFDDEPSRLQCVELWRDGWRTYFQEAATEYDTVLLWEAPDVVRLAAGARYRTAFDKDGLVILRRPD